MLEIRNLSKIYTPKKGVPVVALNNVSLKFADTGMVFLLGKSGSGKSTLLNILGGLDRCNSGEIIIKGVSSKKFKQSHFDSYRNTYVGFIFQEYNILEEFTVGANIGLALELQGKRVTDEAINDILHQLELDGHGARKPNELSGGQKQRVAIARALVKNPKIIMADEPTGALDSNTGKQIFDTLKMLSKDKLVIVVSHDRDFAARYADRIIELADGQVISDTTVAQTEEETAGLSFEGDRAIIPCGYHLTEEDRLAINAYVDRIKAEGYIQFSDRVKGSFVPTDPNTIVNKDTQPFKLIKSRLRLKNAFKIGVSALKFKKFRLTVMIFLSCIAFTFFGLSDTFAAYDMVTVASRSIKSEGIGYAAITAQGEYSYYEGGDVYYRDIPNGLDDKEIEKISKDTGIAFKGVWSGCDIVLPLQTYSYSEDMDYYSDYDRVTPTVLPGMVEVDGADLKAMGMKLVAGKMPDGTKAELAVSEFVYGRFEKYGFITNQYEEKLNQDDINSYSDLIGRTLTVAGVEHTITGIIDTGFDIEQYRTIFEPKKMEQSTGDVLLEYALVEQFETEYNHDYVGMAMVGEGRINTLVNSNPYLPIGYRGVFFNMKSGSYNEIAYVARLSSFADGIVWLDDSPRSSLADDEVVVIKRWYEESGEKDTGAYLELADYDGNYSDYEVKVVGYIEDEAVTDSLLIMSDSYIDELNAYKNGLYSSAIGAMPDNVGDIADLLEYSMKDRGDYRYFVYNPVTYQLDLGVNDVLHVLAKAFMWVGLVFCIFASIMFANFISTSVARKKQEIGILRAIGSRSNDVFSIFFSEAFVIAFVNFVISTVLVFIGTKTINYVMTEEIGLAISILSFGIRQIALIFGISLLVAFLSSFIPVKKIASKKPIDAIRNR